MEKMRQVRLELSTWTSSAHLLPGKHRAQTDCATGALAPPPGYALLGPRRDVRRRRGWHWCRCPGHHGAPGRRLPAEGGPGPAADPTGHSSCRHRGRCARGNGWTLPGRPEDPRGVQRPGRTLGAQRRASLLGLRGPEPCRHGLQRRGDRKWATALRPPPPEVEVSALSWVLVATGDPGPTTKYRWRLSDEGDKG